MKILRPIIALMCFIGMTVYEADVMAQDPHFSQYYNSPLYQNPAFTGEFPGLLRLQLNYRNQWNSVTVPFQTMMAAFDMTPVRRFFKRDRISFGLTFLRDKAGDSDYGIVEAGFNFAYHVSLNRRATNFLSFGVQAGFAQRSINYTALRFPGQFDGSAFDPAMSNGENFALDNLGYPDFGGGISWSFTKQKTKYQFGISGAHLNSPELSFMENTAVRLEPKLGIQGQVSFPIKENWDLIPSFHYEHQDIYNKFIIGTLFHYSNPFKGTEGTSFYLGLFSRMKDAAILAAGVEYGIYNFGISYDINYSGLHPASSYQGGFEVSLSMILHKQNKKIKREINCPVF